jgi:hypothetical protein
MPQIDQPGRAKVALRSALTRGLGESLGRQFIRQA